MAEILSDAATGVQDDDGREGTIAHRFRKQALNLRYAAGGKAGPGCVKDNRLRLGKPAKQQRRQRCEKYPHDPGQCLLHPTGGSDRHHDFLFHLSVSALRLSLPLSVPCSGPPRPPTRPPITCRSVGKQVQAVRPDSPEAHYCTEAIHAFFQARLFVTSIVFETALTPIFNWRFFARHFEGSGSRSRS